MRVQRIRSWTTRVLERSRAPDAFFAVAFFWDDPTQHNPSSTSAWHTDSDRIPIRLMPHFAIETLRGGVEANVAESEILRTLGYVRDDDPDESA